MSTQDLQPVSPGEILESIWRHKLLLSFCIILTLIPAFLYNHFATPIYRSAATVVFENYPKTVVGELQLFGASAGKNYLLNQIEEMKTVAFARQIFEALPEHLKQAGTESARNGEGDLTGVSLARVHSNLDIETIRNTDIVKISFSSERPEIAQAVAAKAVEVLQNQNLKVRRQESSSVKHFIDKQIEVVRQRLNEAEEKLRAFKASENIISLEDESKQVLERITQAEVLSNQIETERDAKQRRLAILRQKLKEQKESLSSDVIDINSPLIARLKEKLIQLQLKYANLKVQNFSENHPKMVELKLEIDQTKKRLTSATRALFADNKYQGVIDPLSQIQKYVEEAIFLEVELESLKAQETKLKQILLEYSRYLKSIPDKELELFRLMRDKEVNNKIYLQLLEQREQARIREASEIANIRLIEPAYLPRLPSYPRKILNILIGLFSGTIFGLFLVFIKDFSRSIPRTQEEIEELLRQPVLATIPKLMSRMQFSADGRILTNPAITQIKKYIPYKDAYHYLWNALQLKGIRFPYSLMITSSIPHEGKTTMAVNLAITAAEHGTNVILVEGDLRRPVLHKIFDMPRGRGLTDVFSLDANGGGAGKGGPSRDRFDDETTATTMQEIFSGGAVQQRELLFSRIQEVMRPTGVKNLDVITCGTAALSPSIFWQATAVQELWRVLRSAADLLIVDVPPIIGIPDTLVMASHFDAILLCIESGRVERKLLLRAASALTQVNTRVLGAVLNKVEPQALYGANKYYKSYLKYYTSG